MGAKNKLFHRDKPISGIDINETGIKIMAINPKKWLVTAYGSADLDPGRTQEDIENHSGYIEERLNKLLSTKLSGKLPDKQVVLSVPTSQTYSRSVILPIDVEDSLDQAIKLEAEQYIPVPIEELYMDYQIIERNGKEITVLLSAVPKRLVDVTMGACLNAGLDVVMIEPSISAVARLLMRTEEGHLPTLIVDIGAATTDIAILDDFIRVTGGVPIGGNSFTLDIASRLDVSLENAHQLKVLNGLNVGPRQADIMAALDKSLGSIRAEITKVMRYYTERLNSTHRIEQVIIVGGGSNIPGLGEYFTNSLVMPVRIASPWQTLNFGNLQQPSRQYKPRYITAAGLASVNSKEIWT